MFGWQLHCHPLFFRKLIRPARGFAMSEYDDSLEIGIAAGLDPATALAISECEEDNNPQPPASALSGPLGFAAISECEEDNNPQPSAAALSGPLGFAAIVFLALAFFVVLGWLLSL